MGRQAGTPLLGSVQNPLVSDVGGNILCSKKLVGAVAVVILVTALIFFTVEETKIAAYARKNRVAQLQNNAIKQANDILSGHTNSIEQEHEKLYDHFTTLLEQEEEELDLSGETMTKLRDQLAVIQTISSNFTTALKEKDKLLTQKENFLHTYQFKIQSKQKFIEELASIIGNLTESEAPDVSLDKAADEFIWNDSPDDDTMLYEEDDDLYFEDDWVETDDLAE